MSEFTIDGEVVMVYTSFTRKEGKPVMWVVKQPSVGTLAGRPFLCGTLFYPHHVFWDGLAIRIPFDQILSLIQYPTTDAFIEAIKYLQPKPEPPEQRQPPRRWRFFRR